MLASILLAMAGIASAREFRLGDIVISNPWSRATPKGSNVGAGYLVIENLGKTPDRLLGGSIEDAARFEIHDVVVEDGVMKMRGLKEIELPAGASIEARPGGRHIMLVGLLHPLVAGETARGALQFERAGDLKGEFKLGIKEVDEGIWLVSFMHFDFGYFDLEQKTLQTLDNPFSPKPITDVAATTTAL